uniref:DUF932 domain-containing protein n=2 Tax=viral metagenome TaxID=1070528 RepID=A0A6M3IRT5_9ZZZZ
MENGQLDEIKAQVREMFPDIEFPDVSPAPVWYGKRNHERIPSKVAIIGTFKDDAIPYGIVSASEYQIVTHEEVIWNMIETFKEHTDLGKCSIRPVLVSNGAKMFGRVAWDAARPIEVKKGDLVGLEATFRNSYDAMWKYSLGWGARRIICSNGMAAFHMESLISHKHNNALDTEVLHTQLAEGMDRFSEQIGVWTRWVRQKITAPVLDNMWVELGVGSKYKEQILALPQTGTGDTIESLLTRDSLTAWDLNSSLTQFYTHNVESEMVRINATDQIDRVLHRHFS